MTSCHHGVKTLTWLVYLHLSSFVCGRVCLCLCTCEYLPIGVKARCHSGIGCMYLRVVSISVYCAFVCARALSMEDVKLTAKEILTRKFCALIDFGPATMYQHRTGYFSPFFPAASQRPGHRTIKHQCCLLGCPPSKVSWAAFLNFFLMVYNILHSRHF